jgi:hypothetical protein
VVRTILFMAIALVVNSTSKRQCNLVTEVMGDSNSARDRLHRCSTVTFVTYIPQQSGATIQTAENSLPIRIGLPETCMKGKLFTLASLVLLFNVGCTSEKKAASQLSAVEPALQETGKQPTAAPVAMVQEQPTMFEWRGIHDGMTVAEFQAKDGKNCAESPSGSYACVNTDVDADQSLTALFHHGRIYSFRVSCDGSKDYREYQDLCRSVATKVKAHFGKAISDDVKYGTRAITWRSELELALYVPPGDEGGPGSLEVCSPALAPPGQCHPD